MDNTKKSVSIWLSNQEKNDPLTKGRLNSLYSQYSDSKYRVAVFISGKASLQENTEALLLKNSGYLI